MKIKKFLLEEKGFKFRFTLLVTFRKEKENGETMYSPPIYFISKTQTVDNKLDVDNNLDRSYKTILSRNEIWFDKNWKIA